MKENSKIRVEDLNPHHIGQVVSFNDSSGTECLGKLAGVKGGSGSRNYVLYLEMMGKFKMPYNRDIVIRTNY